ncbi:hypothetical protein ABIE67_009530 [Streptomyces sp. V4I8]
MEADGAYPRKVEKITVMFLNGREHFIVTDDFVEHGGERARVYRWSYRTAIAE